MNIQIRLLVEDSHQLEMRWGKKKDGFYQIAPSPSPFQNTKEAKNKSKHIQKHEFKWTTEKTEKDKKLALKEFLTIYYWHNFEFPLFRQQWYNETPTMMIAKPEHK